MVNIDKLKKKAQWVRRQTLEMCIAGNIGHLASSLSCVDIFVALYYGRILKKDDHFILSKGHGGIALYPILSDLGYFPKSELNKFGHGGILGTHPENNIAGIETITGSLGHGLGIATGMALGNKLDGKAGKFITLLGDGECYEGSIWEAAMFAGSHKLDNLTAIIDRNTISATDFTENFNKLVPFVDKWQTFGWEAFYIDGHSFKEIINAVGKEHTKPLAIIANTIKGKGISFMESDPICHSLIPSGEKLKKARAGLA